MTIGVLIVTHEDVGRSMLRTATSMLGLCPLEVEVLSVSRDDDPDQLQETARGYVAELERGDGVLVLTDMYGSTPSNIASSMLSMGNVKVIAGMNLPMLVRILNYPTLSLEQLVEKAVDGGREGVMTWCFSETDSP